LKTQLGNQLPDQRLQVWFSMKAGNRDALKELYLAYSNQLYNYGAKFTADKDLIKDAIQELFVLLWERRAYLADPQDIKNYLFKAFRSAVFKKLAYSQRRESLDEGEDYAFRLSVHMEDYLVMEEDQEAVKRRIQAGLDGLTSRQREVIFLKFYEGLSYAEIAEVLDISVKGSYKLMARALEILRHRLGKQEMLLLLLLLQLKLFR